jgi:hypothetical protein
MVAARYSVLIGLLLCAVTSLAAQASQEDREHQRFWIHLNLGYGSANVSCDQCTSGPRLDGVTYGLELGGTVNEHFRLGGSYETWTHGSGGGEDMENFGLVGYYYPSSSGLFLKGEIGFSEYHAAGIPGIGGTGWGYTGGLGWELPIGSSVTIIPFVDYVVGNVGELDYDDGSGEFATGWNQNFLAIGLSFGFYPRRHRY